MVRLALATYVAKRLALIPLILFGVLIIMFVITRMLPGDPAAVRAGGIPDPEILIAIRKEMGLDQPVYVQFVIYLKELASGNLGTAFMTGRPVAEELLFRLPATIELGLVSEFIALIIGFPLGIISAIKRDTIWDHLSRLFGVLGVSIPNYYLGLLGIYILFFQLRLLPGPMGRIAILIEPPSHITGLYLVDSVLTLDWDALWSSLAHIALPAMALSFFTMAPVIRITRSSMLEVVSTDYVRTAKAAGIPERQIIFQDILKNAMIPLLTVISFSVGNLIGGVVVIEQVFGWPGVGLFALSSFQANDHNPIQAFVLLSVAAFLIVNLVTDALYGLVDPRIRYG